MGLIAFHPAAVAILGARNLAAVGLFLLLLFGSTDEETCA